MQSHANNAASRVERVKPKRAFTVTSDDMAMSIVLRDSTRVVCHDNATTSEGADPEP